MIDDRALTAIGAAFWPLTADILSATKGRLPSGQPRVQEWVAVPGLTAIPAAANATAGAERWGSEITTEFGDVRVLLAGYFPQLVTTGRGPEYRCQLSDGRLLDIKAVDHGAARQLTALQARTITPIADQAE